MSQTARAADAARFYLKWMYVLNTPLKWGGFNYSDLSNFRERMAEAGKEGELFDKLIAQLKRGRLHKVEKGESGLPHRAIPGAVSRRP
ncbi:MAG: hypothetical protein KIH09_09510 [Candidatus Freyarchaeota archaeon]|nr:hypothetical protein [Candidatus Jordarchaeia archaeon]